MPKSLGHGVTGSVRKFQVWQSEQDVVIQEICLLGTLRQKLEKVLHVDLLSEQVRYKLKWSRSRATGSMSGVMKDIYPGPWEKWDMKTTKTLVEWVEIAYFFPRFWIVIGRDTSLSITSSTPTTTSWIHVWAERSGLSALVELMPATLQPVTQ